jgi:hypothetical protein
MVLSKKKIRKLTLQIYVLLEDIRHKACIISRKNLGKY